MKAQLERNGTLNHSHFNLEFLQFLAELNEKT